MKQSKETGGVKSRRTLSTGTLATTTSLAALPRERRQMEVGTLSQGGGATNFPRDVPRHFRASLFRVMFISINVAEGLEARVQF